ncbi:MAG: phytanoyl-CoA dioxygenase family protein [Phenylobacterium sp.]|uniref:phytanoyl-CoA dioxygenase family protein n=1 Tax=Phenylobacterium sp. TaxID=1871053 RepID=UPI002728BEB3|nr:phytanoyl-CoA dioxygenase family protein [Phenylobacterium sp.]MDO8912746.1 phytanoyl-CoA dioxygenase family protein [Phenylobacterium sp.]MDP3102012.1 phytanoyl-CoA dioxygenase family protein [Phenylobacterium sp.]HQT53992.1 phytanoyl-CoA dioxygenase family protein [Phenylobacterium sp.]
MADLQRLPANAPLEAVMAVLDRDGALILEGVISPQTALAMAEELRPYVEATQPGQDAFTGFKTTRTGALVARSAECRTAILDPRVRAICDRVLLPNCTRYQLHLGQLIRIMPGQPAQPIHRDRWAWGHYLKGVEPQLNTIWALTEFTAENGATQVVPGSIDWPDDRRATPGEICQATMPAGSVLVYTGTVFHGGGANTSETDRWGLNITYALGWLRQEENQYLSCPPEIARTLEPELQQLIGYAMGSYALGYYTPPLPPGEGPEVVPPEYALTGDAAGSQLGSAELLGAINAQVRGG